MMQETSVGWDPTNVHRHLPLSVRLYILLIFFFTIFFTIRAILIAWNLWFRPLHLGRTDLSKPEKIKQSARAWLRGMRLEIDRNLKTEVAARFRFLVFMIKSELRSARRVAVSVALFGVGLVGFQVIEVLQEFSATKRFPLSVFSGSVAEFLAAPTVGFIVAGGVYLLSGLFESILARRVANWKYNYDCRATD